MMMGSFLSHKSCLDFMQNCDLPPPAKVLPGSDMMFLESMNRVFVLMGQNEDNDDFGTCSSGETTKLEFLKALRLSQTRARVAERNAASLAKEKDRVSSALLEESRQLYAFRQWMRLLELQVFKLQSQWEFCCSCGRPKTTGKELLKDPEVGDGASCFATLALFLSIAGVGLQVSSLNSSFLSQLSVRFTVSECSFAKLKFL
ncbi:hypothetical protein K2173_021536 [Erythroxylum novogranatense]|uniref:Uncharacterized protein n=1 Tax=Erythroxylum novogranatense TaxID=1862640 RepID=A0AAV8TQ96_9ROSI|nr:hypothetical protein K2173_021536 [Erythroxylum novogranatense]